jgi:rhodanese-related sulfurtransferase
MVPLPRVNPECAMPTTAKQLLEAANAAVPKISGKEAQELVTKGALLVDVRDGTEVAASGKAAGAIHIPRGSLEFKADPTSPTADKNFSTDKTVILHCASGGRAALAGKLLKDMGYEKVYNLGGFKDWVEAGGKVEK